MKTIEEIANILSVGIDKNNSSFLLVTGGNSPLKTYNKLSKCDINWKKISITLIDDRDVLPNSILSNEKTIKDNLLINNASSANYISLRSNPFEILKSIKNFDVGILGFGHDGHIASIFPKHILEENYISEKAIPNILYTEPSGDPMCERITMNMSMILSCKHILILDVPKKRKVFDEAKKNKEMPLYFVLNSSHKSISLLSCY